jgi:polysaccharide pyruvyl transferase WcaK-like protein
MVMVAAKSLLERHPGIQVTIATPFPEIDQPLYETLKISVVRSNRRNLALCIARMTTPRGRHWGTHDPEVQAVRRADLVLDVSGDGMSEDYGPHVVMSHLYPLWLAQTMKIPLMLCAQTIGPFWLTKPLVRHLLNRAAVITPRDASTRDYLQSIGVTQSKIHLTADLSFLLEPAPAKHVDNVLENAPDGFWDRPVLGITLTRLLGHKKSRGREGSRGAFLEEVVSAVRTFVRRHGFSLLVLSHSTGPRPARDDRVLSAKLVSALSDESLIHSIDQDLAPDVIKAVIGRCSLFCAGRLHSAIFALSQSVPTVVIGYAAKAGGVVEPLEQGPYLLEIDYLRADSLLETLEECWTHKKEVRDALERNLPTAFARSRSNFDHVDQLLA